MMKDVRTAGQAAREAGVSPAYIRYLCDVGKLPASRGPRGERLLPAEAVRKFAEGRRQQTATRSR
jgi:hypothetical protein